jgi:hypothetical protein
MARALISINGVDAQFAAVAIGSVVMLTNHDEGGETTYAWTILDQPEGTADVLSSAAIESPTLTVNKEGSYALRLVVNQGTGTEVIQTAVVAVLDARTGERIPAATESTESGLSKGWALALNRVLAHVLRAAADANIVVAQTPGSIAIGTIVQLTGIATVNVATPSVFTVTQIATALGTAAQPGRLGIVVDGVVPGITTAGALVQVRILGLVPLNGTGSPAVGDRVFLGDTGQPSLVVGTVPRVIGHVVASSGGSYQWVIDGAVRGGFIAARQFTASSGTYTPTPGTTRAHVRQIGGGGGGGGAGGGGNSAAGAGGGAGVPLDFWVGVVGVPLTGGAFTNGAGGTGGANTGGTGGTGGDTTLVIGGTTYTAKGATGGGGLASSTIATAFGGVGQTGSSSGAGIVGPALGARGNQALVTSATASYAGGGAGIPPFGTGGAPAAQGQPGGAASGVRRRRWRGQCDSGRPNRRRCDGRVHLHRRARGVGWCRQRVDLQSFGAHPLDCGRRRRDPAVWPGDHRRPAASADDDGRRGHADRRGDDQPRGRCGGAWQW